MFESELLRYIMIGLVVILIGSIILNIIQRKTINNLRESSEILIKDAYFNPITALPNEINFEIILKEQIDRAKRHEKTFLFVYIKLKHFQSDQDIIDAGNILSDCIRNEDSLVHISTDEFVILFNEYLEEKNYNIVTSRIMSTFPKYAIRMGKSTYPKSGEDKKYLLQVAIEDTKR
jgi:GGDEF domain-containing protein